MARSGRSNRGAKPGERRGGRKKGTPNKLMGVNAYRISELCRTYTEEAIEVLVDRMRNSKEEMTKIRCAEALLDRGWGKPAQAMIHSGGEAPIKHELEVTFVRAPSRRDDD